MKILRAQTGLSGAELEKLKTISNQAFVSGVGEDLQSAASAIALVEKRFGDLKNTAGGKLIDSNQYADVADQFTKISKAFSKDFTDVLETARPAVQAFGIDINEAGNLMTLA